MIDFKFEYGLSKVVFGDDNVESTVVVMGDGMTRISTVGFNNGHAGLAFVRSELIDGTPFQEFSQGESEIAVNGTPDDEKVYLLFSDERSLDAIESQLSEARKLLRGMKASSQVQR